MSPLVSLTALILIAQVNAPGLAEALRAVEAGQADVAFGPDVGAAAAHAVATRTLAPDELDRYLQVALRGKAHVALAPHLGRLLASDGPTLAPALRAAGELGAKERPIMLAALGAAATRQSISLAWSEEDERVARGAITLLVGASKPPAVLELVQSLIRGELAPRADWALQVIAGLKASPELVALLLEVERELPPPLHPTLASALVALIDQQPALAAPVVEAIQSRPSPGLLGAAIAMPPDQWDATVSGVMFVITELSPELANLRGKDLDLFVAAINAGADLRVPELLPLLPELCRPTSTTPIRLAGLRAFGELGAKEATIIDQLLLYLPEKGAIGEAAFASLLKRGTRLPMRPAMWQDWRTRTPLVVMTPEEHTRRLLGERRARYVARGGGQRLNNTTRRPPPATPQGE